MESKRMVKSPGGKLLRVLRHVFFWSLGGMLLYLAFRNQDISQVMATLKAANYGWAGVILLITIMSHLLRVWRWKMLIQPLQYRPSTYHTFLALMFGYLVNYAVPRLGEISRCAAMKKTEKIPVDVLLGTVVAERAVDLLSLGIVTILAFFWQFERVATFFMQKLWQPIWAMLENNYLLSWHLLVVFVVVVLLLLWLGWYQRRHLLKVLLFRKIFSLAQNVLKGVVTIWFMENKWLFIFYSILIWCSYLLMTYLWFFSFPQTSHLSLSVGLVMMVIGSLGRTLPIQGGGIGAYHYFFSQGILLFGVAEAYGIALAILIHGFQTAYYLLVGGIATLLLMGKKH